MNHICTEIAAAHHPSPLPPESRGQVDTNPDIRPHAPRRGCLRHGNPSGDPDSAPRCGARTRSGCPCRQPAMQGKARCRLHGGKSTGPRTTEGRERTRRASLQHGYRTHAATEARKAQVAWSRAVGTATRLIDQQTRMIDRMCRRGQDPATLPGFAAMMRHVLTLLESVADGPWGAATPEQLAQSIAAAPPPAVAGDPHDADGHGPVSQISDVQPHAPRRATAQTVAPSGQRASRPLMSDADDTAADGTPALPPDRRALLRIPDVRPHVPRRIRIFTSSAGGSRQVKPAGWGPLNPKLPSLRCRQGVSGFVLRRPHPPDFVGRLPLQGK